MTANVEELIHAIEGLRDKKLNKNDQSYFNGLLFLIKRDLKKVKEYECKSNPYNSGIAGKLLVRYYLKQPLIIDNTQYDCVIADKNYIVRTVTCNDAAELCEYTDYLVIVDGRNVLLFDKETTQKYFPLNVRISRKLINDLDLEAKKQAVKDFAALVRDIWKQSKPLIPQPKKEVYAYGAKTYVETALLKDFPNIRCEIVTECNSKSCKKDYRLRITGFEPLNYFEFHRVMQDKFLNEYEYAADIEKITGEFREIMLNLHDYFIDLGEEDWYEMDKGNV